MGELKYDLMDGNKTECHPQCKLHYEIKNVRQCAERVIPFFGMKRDRYGWCGLELVERLTKRKE